jgi:hypothetical protein
MLAEAGATATFATTALAAEWCRVNYLPPPPPRL